MHIDDIADKIWADISKKLDLSNFGVLGVEIEIHAKQLIREVAAVIDSKDKAIAELRAEIEVIKCEAGRAFAALDKCDSCEMVLSHSNFFCPAIREYNILQQCDRIKDIEINHDMDVIQLNDNHPQSPQEFVQPTEPYPEEKE